MSLKIAMRNSMQRFLIALITLLQPVLNMKIMLFSRFMAGGDSSFVIKKGRLSQCIFVLHSMDTAVARRIFIGMDDEHFKAIKAIRWVKELRREGGVSNLLDIGANLGHICIPLVKQGYVKYAVGYEPDPVNFQLLKCNIILNDLEDRISIHNLALGTLPDETLELELSIDNFGDHRIKVSSDDGQYKESLRNVLRVRSTNLDAVVSKDSDLARLLIWMDVQGYEGSVLVGATSLLKQKPAIGLEFWPYGLYRADNFKNLMRCLESYGVFYDLSAEEPDAQPLSKLEIFYNENIQNDAPMMDILVV